MDVGIKVVKIMFHVVIVGRIDCVARVFHLCLGGFKSLEVAEDVVCEKYFTIL